MAKTETKRERDPKKEDINEATAAFLEWKRQNPNLNDARGANFLHSKGYLFSVAQINDHIAAEGGSVDQAPASQPPRVKQDYKLKEIAEGIGATVAEVKLLLNAEQRPAGMPDAELVARKGFGETWRLNLDEFRAWYATRG